MSTLIIEVATIDEVKCHPNADRVEMVRTKGWWCVSQVGQWRVGDKCVYFPPDTVIPDELAENWGIIKYTTPLGRLPDGSRQPGQRIRANVFRGEQSFGFLHKPDCDWPIGTNVADFYHAKKYEPLSHPSGDMERPVDAFHTYTNIENIKNFPDIIKVGEEVVIEEKIHGTNSRMGIILNHDDIAGDEIWTFMCGSHGHRRKQYNDKGELTRYWIPLSDNMKGLLLDLCDGQNHVVVFGEIYGPGVQDMSYGLKHVGFRAFDISVNRKYLDYDDRVNALAKHEIPSTPLLYRGPFDPTVLADLTDGFTTLCDPESAGKFAGREGVVVRPVVERYSPNLPNFGRVIFKSISINYLSRRGGTEYH